MRVVDVVPSAPAATPVFTAVELQKAAEIVGIMIQARELAAPELCPLVLLRAFRDDLARRAGDLLVAELLAAAAVTGPAGTSVASVTGVGAVAAERPAWPRRPRPRRRLRVLERWPA